MSSPEDDPNLMSREEAFAAKLHVGVCGRCRDDVWKDREPFVIADGGPWHRYCAEMVRDALEDAL